MQKFNYLRPLTLKEACETLAGQKGRGRVIAGGTDLMVQMREGRRNENDFIIDLSHIADLRYILEEDDYIHIGPLVTHSDIQKTELLRKWIPFFCDASASVGSPQIRNRGTIGGSICNASPAADPIIPLVALDAVVKITSVSGEREMPLSQVALKPNENCLAPDEILTQITIKKPEAGTRTAFEKIGRRKALAIARMNIGAVMLLDEAGIIKYIRLAPGSVFATPGRAEPVEEMLLGKTISHDLLIDAGEAMAAEMIARTGIRASTAYKKPAISALTRQVLEKAWNEKPLNEKVWDEKTSDFGEEAGRIE